MSPAARVALTVLSAMLAAGLTIGVAALAAPSGLALALPLALIAAALVRWRS